MQYFTKFLITFLLFSLSSKVYSQDGKIDTQIVYGNNYINLPKDYNGPILLLLGGSGSQISYDLFKKYTNVEFSEFFFDELVPKFLRTFNIIEYKLDQEIKKQSPDYYPITIRVIPLFSEFKAKTDDDIPVNFSKSHHEPQLYGSIQIFTYQNILINGHIARLNYAEASRIFVGTEIKDYIEDALFKNYIHLKKE